SYGPDRRVLYGNTFHGYLIAVVELDGEPVRNPVSRNRPIRREFTVGQVVLFLSGPRTVEIPGGMAPCLIVKLGPSTVDDPLAGEAYIRCILTEDDPVPAKRRMVVLPVFAGEQLRTLLQMQIDPTFKLDRPGYEGASRDKDAPSSGIVTGINRTLNGCRRQLTSYCAVIENIVRTR